MAESISANTEPSVWVRHFNFLDFEALGLAAPTWINMVRDPVSCYKSKLILFILFSICQSAG